MNNGDPMSKKIEPIDCECEGECSGIIAPLSEEAKRIAFQKDIEKFNEAMELSNTLLAKAAPIGEYQRQLHRFKEAVEDRHELFRRDFKHMQNQMDFIMGDRYKDLYERVSYLESVLLRNKQEVPKGDYE